MLYGKVPFVSRAWWTTDRDQTALMGRRVGPDCKPRRQLRTAEPNGESPRLMAPTCGVCLLKPGLELCGESLELPRPQPAAHRQPAAHSLLVVSGGQSLTVIYSRLVL